MPKYGLPVLMYHHINNHAKDLVTITPDDFDKQMAYLAKKGYSTLDTQEALACLKRERPLTGKEVLITFDDGFLDNWVYAYPILQRYGLNAVIFVATCFVESKGPVRPNLADVWKAKINADQLPAIKHHKDFNYTSVMVDKDFGTYTRWSELAQMEANGVIDVQAHTHFHGEYFTGNKITGFNSNPNDRIAMITDGDSRLGIPIYAKKPAALAKRYYDDAHLRDYLADYVQNNGGEFFFERQKENWRQELENASQNYIRQNELRDSYETVAEYEQRVKNDLTLSKNLIENKLKKKCLSLAWPWGAHNDQLLKWAKELGYQVAFTTERGTNIPGTNLMCLNRCVVKKGDVGWLAQQLRIYSRPKLSRLYLKIRRKL